METTRLVQLIHPTGRRIALVQEPDLILIDDFKSIYQLALSAIDTGKSIKEIIHSRLSADKLNYDAIYAGNSKWQLLPSFDHPENPLSCMVSGTGLTHKNSALNRQMMHQSADEKSTDSMQMYQWGLDGGNPTEGQIGVQPEWFYKGNGTMLKAHGENLEVPPYAKDGGEEPEIAGLYVIDKNGNPYRVGFSTGNEFSDHMMEKMNYLYLAPSKLRQSAIGPELVIDADFSGFTGLVCVMRDNEILWQSPIKSGEANMAHNLSNLEYHHFKYAGHRIPLQAHVHYFGADAFSFGNKIKLQEGDTMSVQWDGMGRALQNNLKISAEEEQLIEVKPI